MDSVKFLQKFRPGGPWTLTFIVPDGRVTTTTFFEHQIELMRETIEARRDHENIYFQVNSAGEANLTKKAKKTDIVEAEWLHVDVDPQTDDPNLFDAERKNILKSLQEANPAPTMIIDSGGGYQAFWRLDAPEKPDGKDWTEFESYNRWWELEFKGDHCHNIDRIMRLPGTINHPNAKKRQKGRATRQTELVSWDDKLRYDMSVFQKAPKVDGGAKADGGRINVTLSGNLPRLDDVGSELAAVATEGEFHPSIPMLIVNGSDVDHENRWNGDRSRATFYVVCELVRAGVPDDYIAACLLDGSLGISGHTLDQANPEGYVVRQIQRAKEQAVHKDLPDMNDTYFVALVGGKFRVVEEEESGELSYMDKTAFMDYYSNVLVEVGTDVEGNIIHQKKGKWWLAHPQRRSYKKVVFAPGGEVPSHHYNLWRGFAVAPQAGNAHEPILEHILKVICAGNHEHYEYVIRWCARLVQYPATQSETALVLRGREGTGKNTFVTALGDLMPQHYFETASSEQVVGKFNGHLKDKVLVHANEAFFAGDKKHEADLKALITDGSRAFEAKGIDIVQGQNFVHLIMSSNSDWVVPAGADARRYVVLDVAPVHIQDSDYFARLKSVLGKTEFKANFLHFLLSIDLKGWHVRNAPKTEALQDQKKRTFDSLKEWLYICLNRGNFTEGDDWPGYITTGQLVNSYVYFADQARVNRRSTEMTIGEEMKKLGAIKVKRDNRHGWKMPSIYECRQVFDTLYGGPFDWDDPDNDPQQEIPI